MDEIQPCALPNHYPSMIQYLPTIDTWRVLISGFLQDEGKPTGMVRLWREISAEHSGPSARVELRSWNDNYRQLAELIWRMQSDEVPPTVKVYAYSWGAGWGAMELARRLRRRGLRVARMVLSDPVWRSRWGLLAPLALVPGFSIEVPTSVDRVRWFRLKTPRKTHVLGKAQRRAQQLAQQ